MEGVRVMHLEGRQRNCGLNDRHGSLNQPDLQRDHTLIAGRVRIGRCLDILARGPSRRSMRESLLLAPSAHEGPSFRYGHSSSAVAGVSLLRSGRIPTELEGADSLNSVLQRLRSDELPVLWFRERPHGQNPPVALGAYRQAVTGRRLVVWCREHSMKLIRGSQGRMGRLQLRVGLDSAFFAASRRFGESRGARRLRSAKSPQGQMGRHRIRPHAWRADERPPTRGTVQRPQRGRPRGHRRWR